MGDSNRLAALDSHMSANGLNFVEYTNARSIISYTNADGTVDKLWSARLRENYIFVDIGTANHTHAVGDKLTIKAGLTWGNYQIKQDLIYVFNGNDQELSLSTDSVVHTGTTIKSLALYNDAGRWAAPSIEVTFNGATGVDFPAYADNLDSMNIEYKTANGEVKSIADFVYNVTDGNTTTFVMRLGNRNTTGTISGQYNMMVGDTITFKAGSYVASGLRGLKIVEDVTFTITNPSAVDGYVLGTVGGGSGNPSLPAVYNVIFNTNGGSAVSSQTVNAGETAVRPSDPYKSGFTFDGWLFNGAPYNFSTPVNDNITLTAKWVENSATPSTYTVAFYANGGTLSGDARVTVNAGGRVTKPADPVKDGYTFKGWYYNGVEYDFSGPVNSNMTLRAEWTKSEGGNNGGNAGNTNNGGESNVSGGLSCGSALIVSALVPSAISCALAGAIVAIVKKRK